ncbi:anion transporter [Halorubrum sp. JWXQ-INN 858]|uniref:SLC13 family permease n=1 Tax=Halorubrum sp. JWXQ-INN 858 TaxID=2690782 RepID=UPI001359E16C|nr:SLC13 family permease [Halorubrum sp. JWXQ-INN 858]MWV63838.1 anion transporter [Halorubrum sp. JWXQ-INN 858]
MRLPSRSDVGRPLGPVGFALLWLGGDTIGLAPDAAAALACTAWIVVWWVTEAVPIPVTSLLPIVLFPATGILGAGETTTAYGDPIVFLLLGGFLLALAVERTGLHERVSLYVISRVGVSAPGLLFGFMAATALLSMWISNTATAMLMVPIAIAVISQTHTVTPGPQVGTAEGVGDLVHDVDEDPESLPATRFGVTLMLGIAYAASVGGVGTLIGSPPNAVLAGVAESQLGVDVGFLEWMRFGLPVAVVGTLAVWATLLVVVRPTIDVVPGREAVAAHKLTQLGPASAGERRVAALFGIVALGWLTRPFLITPIVPAVTDATIAIAGGVAAFLVPTNARRREFLLDWEYALRLPWGVLLLLGAGFALARAFQRTGLDGRIADLITGVGTTGLLGLVVLLAAVVVVLTNVTSNTATASVFSPVAVAVAGSMGLPPLSLLATVALAASFAFVLPVATAPNAIVFGSGYLTVPEMARIGAAVSVVGTAVIVVGVVWWLPLVWG